MTHYEHLIIGGGMTADAAVGGIHQIDPHASIGASSWLGKEAYVGNIGEEG